MIHKLSMPNSKVCSFGIILLFSLFYCDLYLVCSVGRSDFQVNRQSIEKEHHWKSRDNEIHCCEIVIICSSVIYIRPPRAKMSLCGRSTRPCGQRTKIYASTVHLMDEFGSWTKIIILRWTTGRIFDDGPSTSWTVLDDGPLKMSKCGQMYESPSVEAWLTSVTNIFLSGQSEHFKNT